MQNLAQALVQQLLLSQPQKNAFFGVSGAHIESVFYALQSYAPVNRAGSDALPKDSPLKNDRAKITLFKHESQAVAAAAGWSLAVNDFCDPSAPILLPTVLSTAGGAAFQLIASLAETQRSQIPLLAIVGTPDLGVNGAAHQASAFQQTDEWGDSASPQLVQVLESVSVHCQVVVRAEDLLTALTTAQSAAKNLRGPAVLVVPSHFWTRPSDTTAPNASPPINLTDPKTTAKNVITPFEVLPFELLNEALKKPNTVLLLGEDASQSLSARGKWEALAVRNQNKTVTTLRGRGSFLESHPLFAGVCGQISLTAPQALQTLQDAKHVVVVGTRLDLLDGPNPKAPSFSHLDWQFFHPFEPHQNPRVLWTPGTVSLATQDVATQNNGESSLHGHPQAREQDQKRSRQGNRADALLSLEDLAPPLDQLDWSQLWIDAGNAAAQVSAQVQIPKRGRMHLALGMGSMGFAIGASLGAARASQGEATATAGALVHPQKKTIALLGDGGFWMHGLELHTAIENNIPILWIIADNHSHAMCILREKALGPTVHQAASFNLFSSYPIAAGLQHFFPSLHVREASTTLEYQTALKHLWSLEGPCVLVAKLTDPAQIPPAFVPFQTKTPDHSTQGSKT